MIKRLFHFLGSVHLAVTLIGFTALFVIAGTILESRSESHAFASLYTYNHPAFIVLLCFFFVNILVSALRRWPFKARHIPFLITHLGLLMILTGTILKKTYGIQGSMLLREGSGSGALILADIPAIKIEKRSPEKISGFYEIGKGNSPFPDLDIQVLGYDPHSRKSLETWVKGDFGIISGLQPFKMRAETEKPMPVGKIRLMPDPEAPWDLYGLHTSNIEKTLEHLYLEGAKLAIVDKISGTPLYEGPLGDALNEKNRLHLNFSSEKGFADPELVMNADGIAVHIPLSGAGSLLAKDNAAPHIAYDISREGALAILQEKREHTYVAAFDRHGRVWCEPYRTEDIRSIVVYDEGYKGYAVTAEIPFHPDDGSRKEKEEEISRILKAELKNGIKNPEEISPPLKLLYHACRQAQVDFTETFVDFLDTWNLSNSWLLPAGHPLPSNVAKAIGSIDWEGLPIERFDDSASAFSAALRAFGIHKCTITPPCEVLFPPKSGITLEAPLTQKYTREPATAKIEENLPRIILKCGEDVATLGYDRTGTGLGWPVHNGEYLLKFQPKAISIPFHLRLRQARQINYPGSNQPFSYECDLLISDTRDGSTIEKTLSMNRVHESWDGYRFYLANITPSDESAVKRVQLIVNHDPGKYYLTYPGGLLVTLGIILLFWVRKK